MGQMKGNLINEVFKINISIRDNPPQGTET